MLLQVTFLCTARAIAYDGIQQSGFQYYSTKQEQPLQTTLGTGSLPEGGAASGSAAAAAAAPAALCTRLLCQPPQHLCA
jgi:hypothetical protein